MPNVSTANFGPLIAYLIPGATVLLGFSQFSPMLQTWFAATPTDAPTLSGFLYLTVAALAAGMTLNALRWVIVDRLHSYTGLSQPRLDFAKLGRNVEAYNLLISIHYQHYQFYANMLVAIAVGYACYRVKLGIPSLVWSDLGFIVLEAIFLITSRDTLQKYYSRGEQLLAAGKHKRR